MFSFNMLDIFRVSLPSFPSFFFFPQCHGLASAPVAPLRQVFFDCHMMVAKPEVAWTESFWPFVDDLGLPTPEPKEPVVLKCFFVFFLMVF